MIYLVFTDICKKQRGDIKMPFDLELLNDSYLYGDSVGGKNFGEGNNN